MWCSSLALYIWLWSVICKGYVVEQHTRYQWGYVHGSDENTITPSEWSRYYPLCGGDQQSPIHIHSKECTKKESLDKVHLPAALSGRTKFTVTDNGHTLQMTPTTTEPSVITVGNTAYGLLQFHMHWGEETDATKTKGSEHKIDNRQTQTELHFVTYKMSYGSAKEAEKHRDGITVFAVLFEQKTHQAANCSRGEHSEMILAARSLDETVPINAKRNVNLKVSKLFPADSGYYTYLGSFTTPPCSQVVRWFVFKEILGLPKGFLKYAARLKIENGGTLYDNYREPQPLNGRTVYCTTF